MEAADPGDWWRRGTHLRSTEDTNWDPSSCWVSSHPSTAPSASECSSKGDKSAASIGLTPHRPQDTKWWLLMQPDLDQQLNALEAEVSTLGAGYVPDTTIDTKDHQLFEELADGICMKDDTDSSLLPPLNDHTQDLGSDDPNCLAAKRTKKVSPEMECQWMGSDTTGPWWRSVGKDELASLLAQKSLGYIENCDLPRPQEKQLREQPSHSADIVDHKTSISSSVDFPSERGVSTQNFVTSSSMDERDSIARDRGLVHNVLDGPSSGCHGESTHDEQIDLQEGPENNFSTSELFEALCHSQSRAREAEEAAQQAYTEKEHIVTLFFRQASELFAYRQWLQLLQLESFYLQLKNGNLPALDLVPGMLPQTPQKGKNRRKETPHKTGKRRQERKYTSHVALAAAGLGFAGAGFLLGWTMGRLLFPLN